MKLAHALLLAGGGLAAGVATWFGLRRASQIESEVLTATGGDAEKAAQGGKAAEQATTSSEVQAAAKQVEEAAEATPPVAPEVRDEVKAAREAAQAAKTPAEVKAAGEKVAAAAKKMTGNARIALRITGYWPFTAKDSERKMEGGVHDRKGRPLHTLEDFFAGKSDHVSLSGDDAAWPYGQKILIKWPDGRTVVGRVTDTGRNFRGSTKVYRTTGKEPTDICVYSKATKLPTTAEGEIVRGDHLDKKGKQVVASKFQGQNVVVGAACAYCKDGYHELCDGLDGLGACGCSCHQRAALSGIDVFCARRAA